MHNNPVEEIDHQRQRVLFSLDCLKKLDTVVISLTEKKVAENWANIFFSGKLSPEEEKHVSKELLQVKMMEKRRVQALKKDVGKDIIDQYANMLKN